MLLLSTAGKNSALSQSENMILSQIHSFKAKAKCGDDEDNNNTIKSKEQPQHIEQCTIACLNGGFLCLCVTHILILSVELNMENVIWTSKKLRWFFSNHVRLRLWNESDSFWLNLNYLMRHVLARVHFGVEFWRYFWNEWMQLDIFWLLKIKMNLFSIFFLHQDSSLCRLSPVQSHGKYTFSAVFN